MAADGAEQLLFERRRINNLGSESSNWLATCVFSWLSIVPLQKTASDPQAQLAPTPKISDLSVAVVRQQKLGGIFNNRTDYVENVS